MARDDNSTKSPRIVNRKARHDFHILESLEVGIVLQGSEVKSIRQGQVSLAEGFASVEPDGTLNLRGVDIAPYKQAMGHNGHEPRRVRRLLAHKREIQKLLLHIDAKGRTIVPLTMYFLRGKVKLEIGVAEGKKQHDKRQDIKKREADREMKRAMSRRRD